ncbi:MAG: RluA family pseudouridine synthase [Leptospirales bacterium]|nr:RluA family pseudouridine synthase [Leptospirales bacterium]
MWKKNEQGGSHVQVEQTFQIQPGESGVRLDIILARRFPVLNREDWQVRIREGFVLLRGQSARPSARPGTGDEVRFTFTRRPEPEVNRDVQVIFEDDEAIVINKPPNLPVHPSGIYFQNTLVSVLREMWPDDPPRMVHRLDRETSGCMLLAKSSAGAARFQKQFTSGSIRKEYLVLVFGKFPDYVDAAGFLSPAGRPVHKKLKFTYEMVSSGISARTEFTCIEQNRQCSLLRARLHSGRMHQIRATLCSLGFPLVGDRLYGIDDSLYLKFVHGEETDEDLARLGMDRTALHSTLLEFESGGKRQTVEQPIPEDISLTLTKLRNNA